MSNRLPLGGQLSGDEIRLWREGYRRYLIGKGMPSEAASDIAAKVILLPSPPPVPYKEK